MNARGFQHLLIALAILAAQWVGVAHSIEHRETLQAGWSHGHNHAHPTANNNAVTSDLLHSCLLFDGLTTAHAAVSYPPTKLKAPLLAQLATQSSTPIAPRNTLFTQRVRVRDPPLFS